MSSGQGDTVAAKADDDTELKSPSEGDTTASKDQVDHVSESSLDKATKSIQELVTKDTSDKTDSGFKDNVLTDIMDKTKSNSDNTDDNSDEDLELKWDDDDTDEQNIIPLEVILKTSETESEVDKPMHKECTNISSTHAIGEKTLESLPLNNEDSILSPDLAESNLPINKVSENKAISVDIVNIINENKLLKGPESETVDEDKLLKISDENKLESLSDDIYCKTFPNSCTKIVADTSDTETLLDKPVDDSTINNASKTDIAIETSRIGSLDSISKNKICAKNLELVSTENNEKVISHLESTSPIQDKSHLALSQSSPKDSIMDTPLDINTEHGLNKPDMMLEIPTQDIIELIDDTDISISETYDDDKMDVDNANDSSKLDPVEDIDEAEEEEKADTVILKPADVFRALDTQTQSKDKSNEANKMEDVSEDDWCEIERRLEGFEDSINEDSQLNKQSTLKESEVDKEMQSENDIASGYASSKLNDKQLLEKAANTETLPLTNAQKLVIETENKELLKTLLDTTKLDSTGDAISTTMDVDEEILANPDIESQLKQSPLESTQDNIALETDLDITQSNNIKEAVSCSENQNLKVLNSNAKIAEEIQVHVETTKEQFDTIKPNTKESTIDLSSPNISDKTNKPLITLKVAELTKLKDKVESSESESNQTDKVVIPISEPIEVQVSTNQSDDELLSSTLVEIPAEVKSLSKAIDQKPVSETSISTIEDKHKSKTIDKNENRPGEKLIEDVESSTSKSPSVDKVVPSIPDLATMSVNDKEVTPSTENKIEIGDQISTNKAEVPSLKLSSDVEIQPSISTMEFDSSTNEALSKSKTSEEIKAQPSTSKVLLDTEVLTSTSKVNDDIIGQPSTSSVPDDLKEKPLTSKKTHDIQVKPSTSKVPDFIEAQPSTSKIPDNMEVQPSTSKEVPVLSVELTNTDPDSADDVAETSDSLGLLAESSRVMEDDEEQDEDDDADADADEDDDYDPEDESSNQMTAEHSEDSNAPQSETDQAKDEKEMEIESPLEEKGEDEFGFTTEEKDGAIADEKDVSMDVDEEIVQDVIDITEQVGNKTTNDGEATDTIAVPVEGGKEKQKETDGEKVELSDASAQDSDSMLRKLLAKEEETKISEKKVGNAPQSHVLNIVDLEESSSEDDIQEVKKGAAKDGTLINFDGFKVTIPSSVEVSSVPTEPPEVASEETVIAEDKDESAGKADSKPAEEKPKPKFSLEIFSLDSDEEENTGAPATEQKATANDVEKAKESNKCVNIACKSSGKVPCCPADAATILYYDAAKRRKPLVCQVCADIVVKRTERLVKGIKDLTPLLELDTCKLSSELVEISDSESEDEADTSDEPRETLGETGASFLEANLAKMINETWNKFFLDSRLTEAQDDLNKEMEKLDAESKEIDAMLTECQVATDKLRNDLYATFEQQRRDLGAIIIYDTPVTKYSCIEKDQAPTESAPETRAKRRMSSAAETPAKRPAIPLGYTPLCSDTAHTQDNKLPTVENTKAEDDKDISVLKVSAESAPSDLPAPGELSRPPLRAGMCVYAMRNAFGSWLRTRILEVNGKSAVLGMSQTFTVCRIKYEHKPKGSTKLAPARCLAYSEPATVRLTIGTRIIALFKDSQNPLKKDAFYSGIISEVPNPVNNYRYLVFFDDGYAQYVQHRDTRVVCESSSLVWEEVHPFSREFVREYLLAYPERPMVRLHAGQSLKTEWNGKWWTSRVIQVDASLVQVHFEEDDRTEWIYRGSTRLAPLFLELQAAERHRARPMPRTKAQPRLNMPYVEYTRSDEQNKSEQPAPQAPPSEKEIRQRAVAKKSTALPPAPSVPPPTADSVTSRVVYYTPKNAVKPYKMTAHNCGPHCKRKDVLALKDLRTYNPLAKPLLSGWERQIVRYKGHKEVMYRAPCGRRLRSLRELHRYLRLVHSDMAVDLFDFTPHTHCLAEFVLNKCLVGKKDLSHGKENVPVPCVNYYDESLPEFCSYNTERTPTAGVPLNLDPAFLCGCDCTDDCEDKSKCACWQMTLEGARTIGLSGPNVGYKYKRLPEPLPSGIYECNSRCKCKHTCLNRVAQHPLQLKLQVFKTLNRGWGIRALNDIPKGSFLCVYAGNLLTDATANMDGLNEGDEYLAELDYIEVVEQMKEGYEEDIPEADKRLDKKGAANDSSESEESSSEEETTPSKDEQEDGDFCPGYIGMGVSEFSKRLRKRDKSKKKNKQDGGAKDKEKEGDKSGDDFITISDDEEVREPSSFMAQAGMGKEFISKYRSVRSYFGKDEACYIMDAKVQGNIGRYLNHSCQPNVFVQNVFVDTHDPRFPWVAFFALSHIKAGSELTWNYNYDVGSVPGKVLYCYCGAPNCRGRLL